MKFNRFQTIALDGGGYRFQAGDFNMLTQVTNDQWDIMEQMIRKTNKKGIEKIKSKL